MIIYRTLAVGQNVLCKQGSDGLWKPGVIESVENDNHLCIVRFTHFNALEAIPFESLLTISKIISTESSISTIVRFIGLDTVSESQTNNEDDDIGDDIPNSIADIPSSSTDVPRLGNLGTWEKHTKVRRFIR